ncbi:hypothetical protein [Aeromonas media]|uniref:hypothetical protein n=1 Tax=Aeromonas media TaxID=651 RepID=UPI002B47B4F2|nr:hypothetical protein [Aeromonas media]
MTAMTTVYTLKHANFSGQGLPSILPFVAQDEAEYAYDFRARANRLNDLTGKHSDLVPKRNDTIGGIVQVIDPTVVVDQDNGAGIRLEMGFLETDDLLKPIPIDGSVKFTVMVVAGWSGFVPPPEKTGTSAEIASFYDYGTGINANGFSIEDNKSAVNKSGARVKAPSINLSTPKNSTTRKSVVFLTYDGSTWTLHNKTMGLVATKTNAELQFVAPIPVHTSVVTHATMGHFYSSTLAACYPALYQMAKWNRVLTQAEMDTQYAKSKMAFPSIGI